MSLGHRSSWRAHLGLGIAVAALACALPALAAPSGTVVTARRHVAYVRAFAQVVPVADADLRAGLDGRLDTLDVVPGTHVQARQAIGRMGGSQVRARLDSDRARLAAARSEVKSLGDALAIQRQRLAQHLSTRADVDRAQGALASARAQLVSAQDTLDSDTSLAVLRAPATGTVIEVQAHAGERVRAGQVVARVQPRDALWLMASVYDPHARARVHPGMKGRFVPDDGSPAIAVHVVELPPRLRADGGQPVAMAADGTPPATGWIDGQTGSVRLATRPVTRILVPTRALVMDGGRWWVLLVTPGGDRRQSVTPGPRDGSLTVIVHGLHAGQKIVVDDVYARFHRDISRHYQQQD